MSEWKDVTGEPTPQPLRRLTFALGGMDCAELRQSEKGWRAAVSIYASQAITGTGDDPPLAEALKCVESVLSAAMKIIHAKLDEDSPQVDFPAAVDPVAASERK